MWKVLLGPDVRNTTPETLKERLQALRSDAGIWCVLMSRGGHFAAAIFECNKKQSKNSGTNIEEAALFKILVHKTFHKYVVRYVSYLATGYPLFLCTQYFNPYCDLDKFDLR